MTGQTIFIAGRYGLIGKAVETALREKGYNNIVGERSRVVDLRDREQTAMFFLKTRPDIVVLAAARTGGVDDILKYPVEFIYRNLQIQNNVLRVSMQAGVKKLIHIASARVYPVDVEQPIKETSLMDGRLDESSEPYAMAKITGIKMCCAYNRQYKTNFVSVLPTVAYGPGDNYNPGCNMIPAMINKIHTAKVLNRPTVELWGTGKPIRDVIYSQDIGRAILEVMRNDTPDVVNIGSGKAIAISDIAECVKKVVEYEGEIVFAWSGRIPDGASVRVLDTTVMDNLNWKPVFDLIDGLRATYKDFTIKNALQL